MKLTVGMACYDDFHGVYMTVQSLRMTQARKPDEIIIVDSNPTSENGKMVAGLCSWIPEARYIPTDRKGTSAPRSLVFEQSTGDFTLCVDSHVILDCHALLHLDVFLATNPEFKGLIQGPMLYDNLVQCSTHFDPVWRGGMFGTWGTDERYKTEVAFDIPSQGLGLFGCKKEQWLGFNGLHQQFGGEEGYIQEKYRQAGMKTICLSPLKWLHRFGRPEGVPYPLSNYSKAWNYYTGWKELGLNVDPIYKHFVEEEKLITESDWRSITEGVNSPASVAVTQGCSACNAPTDIQSMYTQAVNVQSDINEHVPTLSMLAAQCHRVTEFGVRHGVSTVGLLHGIPETGRVISYDINRSTTIDRLNIARANCFEFHIGDSLLVDIEPTDMLFIDTKHTADQLYAELIRHAPKVGRWIVMHDTTIYGNTGEDGGPGLLPAMQRFMTEFPEWTVYRHDENNNGLTVISRSQEDKKQSPGLVRKSFNLARAMVKYAASGLEDCTSEEYTERLNMCNMCPTRNGDECSACGCPIAKKAVIKGEKCPLNKWPVLNLL